MKVMRATRHGISAVLVGLAVTVSACAGTPTGTDVHVPSDPELLQALTEAIQDEYHAEEVYLGVIHDFGEVLPFANILGAEERHSSAIARLFQSRGWAVPVSEWTQENVAHFDSVEEACRVGVTAEVANIAVYDRLFAELALPVDVQRVFESNRAASLERHLPAFQRCASM